MIASQQVVSSIVTVVCKRDAFTTTRTRENKVTDHFRIYWKLKESNTKHREFVLCGKNLTIKMLVFLSLLSKYYCENSLILFGNGCMYGFKLLTVQSLFQMFSLKEFSFWQNFLWCNYYFTKWCFLLACKLIYTCTRRCIILVRIELHVKLKSLIYGVSNPSEVSHLQLLRTLSH